jgi:hypothetical protein
LNHICSCHRRLQYFLRRCRFRWVQAACSAAAVAAAFKRLICRCLIIGFINVWPILTITPALVAYTRRIRWRRKEAFWYVVSLP